VGDWGGLPERLRVVSVVINPRRGEDLGKRRVGLVFGGWMVFVLFVAVFGVVLNVPAVRKSGTICLCQDGRRKRGG